jgi:hypothetical protein
VNPRYPVYVISKGRADSRLTVKELERLKVPHHVVIEPQEYDAYRAVIPAERLLQLPFSNLGLGSIPARNWVWEHALKTGAARHWILDDNIRNFKRLHRGERRPVLDGTIFRAAEDFVDRYENIALAGFEYEMFAPSFDTKHPPVRFNTRIYSCILINNAIPYRWRGRYNEDTDLSLRALKDGWCTALFLAFLATKMTTMRMKGGNTDELYKGDGRLDMARSLQQQHPDVTKVTRLWGRWQHKVDYRRFKTNKLRRKPGLELRDEPNNYGMTCALLTPWRPRCASLAPRGQWVRSASRRVRPVSQR